MQKRSEFRKRSRGIYYISFFSFPSSRAELEESRVDIALIEIIMYSGRKAEAGIRWGTWPLVELSPDGRRVRTRRAGDPVAKFSRRYSLSLSLSLICEFESP